ncbi:MAG: hypothetical protein ACR2PQ_06990 [Myxococcota bacterium]
MKLRNQTVRSCLLIAALGAATGLATVAQAAHADSSRITSSLDATSVSPTSEGRIKLRFKEKRSRLKVNVRNLAPTSSYTLRVGDQPWATFDTNRKGRAKLRFGSPAKKREIALPGDPRGSTVSVHNGSDDVLETVLSGSGESDDSRVREETLLSPTAFSTGGRARVRFERRDDGELRFDVDLENVAPGEYRVVVGGIERGVLVTNALGHGEIEWRTDSDDRDHLPLDFDPRGEIVDVLNAAGEIVFTGDTEGQLPGVNECGFQEVETALSPSAAAGLGSGRARLRIRDDCRRDFNVEIEDVPTGPYDLFVDGVLRGTIDVVDLPGQTEGEIEFDTEVDDPGEIFLDFDPSGAALEVRQGDTSFFTGTVGTLDGSGSGGGGNDDDGDDNDPPPGSCNGPVEIEVPLINAGLFPGGRAEARFRSRDQCRTDFQVEIEDVPAGAYELFVGGVLRGVITVAGGEGEIEFDDEPEAGELPIDFDPRGLEVRVESGGAVAFERLFPE